MRIRIFFVIVTAGILGGTLARGARIPGEIPFKLAQGVGIVVQGGIGAVNNLTFLVDTGAVPSVLNEKVASRIGVTGVSASFALLNEKIQAHYVTVDEVRFGSIRAVGIRMVVVDLARYERLLGTRIDAIIGLDILAQNFAIDYKRRKLTVGLSGSAQHVTPAEILTSSGAPYWVLPIDLGGRIFRVLLDTGADNLALFAKRIPKSVLDLREDAPTRRLQPLLLMMGNTPLKKQSAYLLDDSPDALQQIDGVLGPSALGITRIEFDWGHKCLRWETE
jgi:predicted aspartyl protease